MIAIGSKPAVKALLKQMMSGLLSIWSEAKYFPVFPKPVITSSTINNAPLDSKYVLLKEQILYHDPTVVAHPIFVPLSEDDRLLMLQEIQNQKMLLALAYIRYCIKQFPWQLYKEIFKLFYIYFKRRILNPFDRGNDSTQLI